MREALESVDGPLDFVPAGVSRPAETSRATTSAAAPPIGPLVPALGNRVPDLPTSQVMPVPACAVPLVTAQVVRTRPYPSRPVVGPGGVLVRTAHCGVLDRLPLSESRRQITPWDTRPLTEQDPVDHPPVALPSSTPADVLRQVRLQPSPLRVGWITPPHTTSNEPLSGSSSPTHQTRRKSTWPADGQCHSCDGAALLASDRQDGPGRGGRWCASVCEFGGPKFASPQSLPSPTVTTGRPGRACRPRRLSRGGRA